MLTREVPDLLTVQVTQVARYVAFGETAQGVAVPDPATGQSDRHFQFSLPGAAGYPAVVFYRTRRTGTPRFTVRVNAARVTDHGFGEGDEAERTWHEIIPANTVRPDTNELVVAVSGDGHVVFGDIVILYTSDQATVRVPVVPVAEVGTQSTVASG